MLAIRLQRQGRKGYPMYRVAVQEAHRHPTSGRVVAYVGSYNPHTKETTLNLEKVEFYLGNGAQPTPRVVKILLEQKVKLPDWVKQHAGDKSRVAKKAGKLRKHAPVSETKETENDTQPKPADGPDAQESGEAESVSKDEALTEPSAEDKTE